MKNPLVDMISRDLLIQIKNSITLYLAKPWSNFCITFILIVSLRICFIEHVYAEGWDWKALGEYIHADALSKEVEKGTMTLEEAKIQYDNARYHTWEKRIAVNSEERSNKVLLSKAMKTLEDHTDTTNKEEPFSGHESSKENEIHTRIPAPLPPDIEVTSVISLTEILSQLHFDQTFSIQSKTVLGDLIRLEESLKGKNLWLKSGLPCKELNVAMDKLFPPIQFNPTFYKNDAHVKQLYSLACNTHNPFLAHYVTLYQVYALHCDSIQNGQLPHLPAGKIAFQTNFIKLAYGR